MRAEKVRSRATWRLRAVQGLAIVAWAGLAYVVLELDPEYLASRVAFFGALGLALLATFGLAAYALSFALFADPRYRGNLRRSLHHGAVTAAVCVAAAVLQASGLLDPLAGAALGALFVVGQVAVLLWGDRR